MLVSVGGKRTVTGGTRAFFGALTAALLCALVLTVCDNPAGGGDPGGGDSDGADYTFHIGGVAFDMVYVKGGTFTMGVECDGAGYSNECPAHQVTLSDYYITKYELTQAQWVAVMGGNPSFHEGLNKPVESISWLDIVPFLTELNAKAGKSGAKAYRLPTEAEWEFAAKGGTKSQGYRFSGSNDATGDDVAWNGSNSGRETHPVGTKAANELGIHDMNGNVWEWVNDWFEDYTATPKTDPAGPAVGEFRIYRGGGFNNNSAMRLSRRVTATPEVFFNDVGMRVAIYH